MTKFQPPTRKKVFSDSPLNGLRRVTVRLPCHPPAHLHLRAGSRRSRDPWIDSVVSNSARTTGNVAAARAKVKIRKYQCLTENYIFVPLVVESNGPFCQEAMDHFHQLGREIESKSGEPKATEYLLQSVSVAVQKGNALSILGTAGVC